MTRGDGWDALAAVVALAVDLATDQAAIDGVLRQVTGELRALRAIRPDLYVALERRTKAKRAALGGRGQGE